MQGGKPVRGSKMNTKIIKQDGVNQQSDTNQNNVNSAAPSHNEKTKKVNKSYYAKLKDFNDCRDEQGA